MQCRGCPYTGYERVLINILWKLKGLALESKTLTEIRIACQMGCDIQISAFVINNNKHYRLITMMFSLSIEPLF